jgi:hypothetical protein
VFAAAEGGAADAYFASGYLSYNDRSNPEVATYLSQRSGAESGSPPSVLAQAGFGTVMDLHRVLNDLEGDPGDPAALQRALEQSRDHPAFMSHAYTCDGEQVPLLTAVCNSNVRILQQREENLADVVGDWVNGADLVKLFTS